MEYHELVQAQLQEYDRQVAANQLISEARRLNPASPARRSPAAHFDNIVIRVSEGARARQDRRIGNRTPGQMA